jgi:macrodomain Ter protein organizer (MatP/YcbG family)
MHIQHAVYYAIKFDVKFNSEYQELIKKSFDAYYFAFFKKSSSSIKQIQHLKNKYISLLNENTKEATFTREILRLIQIGTSPLLSEKITASLYN